MRSRIASLAASCAAFPCLPVNAANRVLTIERHRHFAFLAGFLVTSWVGAACSDGNIPDSALPHPLTRIAAPEKQ